MALQSHMPFFKNLYIFNVSYPPFYVLCVKHHQTHKQNKGTRHGGKDTGIVGDTISHISPPKLKCLFATPLAFFWHFFGDTLTVFLFYAIMFIYV